MRMLMTILAMFGIVSLTACNTVQGIGQDIKKGGEAIEKAGSR